MVVCDTALLLRYETVDYSSSFLFSVPCKQSQSTLSSPARYFFSLLRVLLPEGNPYLSCSVGTNEDAFRSECWQDHSITEDRGSSASFGYCKYCL